MAIKQIKLSWITAANLEKARHFFVDTLGMKLETNAPEYGWMELIGKEGGCSLGIGAKGQMNVTNAVVTFTVDNIVESKKELEQKGVHFIDDIQEVPGHVKLVTFQDADGNMFQLVEEI